MRLMSWLGVSMSYKCINKGWFLIALTGLVAVTLFSIPVLVQATPYRVAVLQGLDKVTARVSTIEAVIGATTRVGTLEVIVRHCDKRPPEEPPESTAFLEIGEARAEEAPAILFRGWMFASSPALSALEHPVYDVWVINCTGGQIIEPKLRQVPKGGIPVLPNFKSLFKEKK